MHRFRILAFASALAATSAHAEVKESTPDHFLISFTEPLAAQPGLAYVQLTEVKRWWSGEHTWSGKSSNLMLKAEAGGCFCERWKDGTAEHGRVVMALPGKMLRLEASLGPLQELALKGILTFWIRSENAETTLTVEYRVNGASGSGLDTIAPSVDEVLGLQVARLKRYIGTGDPEEPPPADEAKDHDAKPAAKKDAKARRDEAKKPSPKPDAPVKP